MGTLWQIADFLESKDGRLHIDGHPAAGFAAEYGTPVFVFSKNRIRHNINRLLRIQNVIDCKLKVCYAAKANSEPDILSFINEIGSDIEVNSGGELRMALAAGFRGDQIIFNGTSKTHTEIAEAINAGIYAIQADSLFELELIDKVALELQKKANVSLRLVPEIESSTHSGLQTALLTSKFGMMPDGAVEALKRWKPGNASMNICGIHLHIGSQNSVMEPYERALMTLFENLLRIKRETGHTLGHINIGGGFPVNYLRDDSHSPFINPKQRALLSAGYEPSEAIGTAWTKVKARAAELEALELIENIELLIEPGRSVIGDAGICLTTVRNRKERPLRAGSKFQVHSSHSFDQPSESAMKSNSDENRVISNDSEASKTHLKPANLNIESGRETWLLTDAGFNILLSMETYKWYYHLISADRAGDPHRTKYKVAGPLCDGGDVYFDIEGYNRLPDHRLLPADVQPAELLALLNTGAYTVSQMFPYNGRELPAVVLV